MLSLFTLGYVHVAGPKQETARGPVATQNHKTQESLAISAEAL
jgi:hypothetical protein